MRRKTLVGQFLVIFFLTSCSVSQPEIITQVDPNQEVKNIILMIGDGMGLAQISAAAYSGIDRLSFENFQVTGLHKSHSSSDLVTDSAAGATAFATGHKTYNGAIGLNKDSVAVQTILEECEEKGLATGLVATVAITHATPASFIAHQPNRVFYERIAADFLETEIDYFVGGGKQYFDRRKEDNRNLYMELLQKGYQVSDYFERPLEQTKPDVRRPFAYFTADKNPLPVTAGRNYLAFATRQALQFLDNRSEKGFFVMIEGSQIDWGGHSNDGDWMLQETLDFDRAITEALRFAEKDGNTLVIVTADHECGGMCLTEKSKMGRPRFKFSTNGHTASLVPVFAYGPGSDLFHGIYDNTAIYHKMREAFGWDKVLTAERE
jgi:alkaline phosphatase